MCQQNRVQTTSSSFFAWPDTKPYRQQAQPENNSSRRERLNPSLGNISHLFIRAFGSSRLSQGPFWKTFAGTRRLTHAIEKAKLSHLPPVDLIISPSHGVTRRSTLSCRHAGNARCQSDSPWKTLRIFSRARHNIRNHARARERESVGCELAFFTSEICELAHRHGI